MYHPEQDNAISLARVLVAVGLSIAFFAVYAYFFPQPQKTAETPKETSSHQETTNIQPASDIAQEDLLQNNNAPQESNTEIHSQTLQPQFNQKSLKRTTLAHLDSDEFEIEIDALGRIKQVYLKDPKFTKQEQTSLFSMVAGALGFKTNQKEVLDKLPLFGNDSLRTMEVRFTDKSINQKAFSTPYTSNVSRIKLDSTPQEIVLTQYLDDIIVKKTLIIYPNLRYDVRIEVSNPDVEYYVSNGMRPTADPDTYAFRGVFTRNAFDGVLTKFEDGDASHDYVAKKANDVKNSSFIASVDRYYTSLFFTSDPKGLFVVMSGDEANDPMPFVRFEGNAEFQAYIGPKEYHKLASIDETLTDVVEYGRITFFAKPVFLLLDFLYSICGNWGWAIVLLTLVVRIVLYPLTYKGIVSMQKIKDLAPKMKELQTRYKDDPQKLQMHMMDLYKKHGANPLGGCLPLILQIPVFFAIYRVLHNAVELKSSEWILWITDLSAIDPYFVLPILMGVSMYISQRITPSNFTDPMQEKIFKMLPLVFALFFIIFPFPAGLVLYWTVNNIFSIIQQLSINKIMAIKKEKEILAHHQHHEVKK